MKVNFVADPEASNEFFYVNYLKRIPKTKTSHIEIHVILFTQKVVKLSPLKYSGFDILTFSLTLCSLFTVIR